MSLQNKKTEAKVELLLVMSWALLIIAYIYCAKYIDFESNILPIQSISDNQTYEPTNNNFPLYIPNEYEGDE